MREIRLSKRKIVALAVLIVAIVVILALIALYAAQGTARAGVGGVEVAAAAADNPIATTYWQYTAPLVQAPPPYTDEEAQALEAVGLPDDWPPAETLQAVAEAIADGSLTGDPAAAPLPLGETARADVAQFVNVHRPLRAAQGWTQAVESLGAAAWSGQVGRWGYAVTAPAVYHVTVLTPTVGQPGERTVQAPVTFSLARDEDGRWIVSRIVGGW